MDTFRHARRNPDVENRRIVLTQKVFYKMPLKKAILPHFHWLFYVSPLYMYLRKMGKKLALFTVECKTTFYKFIKLGYGQKQRFVMCDPDRKKANYIQKLSLCGFFLAYYSANKSVPCIVRSSKLELLQLWKQDFCLLRFKILAIFFCCYSLLYKFVLLPLTPFIFNLLCSI